MEPFAELQKQVEWEKAVVKKKLSLNYSLLPMLIMREVDRVNAVQ